jgi:hypothetical protein
MWQVLMSARRLELAIKQTPKLPIPVYQKCPLPPLMDECQIPGVDPKNNLHHSRYELLAIEPATTCIDMIQQSRENICVNVSDMNLTDGGSP